MKHSITRRLIGTVLLLETLAALVLVGAVTVNEHHVQQRAFDVSLQGAADTLMGAVSDAEDYDDNVVLEMRGVNLPRGAVYRVTDEQGRVLGQSGPVPTLFAAPETFQHAQIGQRSYRFLVHHGDRIVDPGMKTGGVHHSITIILGAPDGHVWHEVMEAVRFFAIATAVLLGITAWVMVHLVRKSLQPIHDLAREAGEINALHWQFSAPESAGQTEELQPLANALEKALARLEQSFRQQRRFTSDAAHELKTDLAIVKSSLQLLTMKRRSEEEYRRGLELTLDDFTRLERTVERMLTLARLEQPVQHGPQASFLHEAIAEAVHGSEAFAQLRNITVHVDAAMGLSIPVDHRDAALLCSNLLVNALQHSPPGSSVFINAGSSGKQVSLIVRDQGRGIDAGEQEMLFEPFYRGDASRSRKSGGTGLGLSICRAICERVGGSIRITNHQDVGAVVTVLLPHAQPDETSREISATLKA